MLSCSDLPTPDGLHSVAKAHHARTFNRHSLWFPHQDEGFRVDARAKAHVMLLQYTLSLSESG